MDWPSFLLGMIVMLGTTFGIAISAAAIQRRREKRALKSKQS